MNLIVLITGATGGIGHALSLEYASNGNHLILCDQNLEKLEITADACRKKAADVEIMAFDLSSENDVNRAAQSILKKHSLLDRIIFVGGISQRDKAIDTKLEVDRKIMEINYFGHINLTKQLLPALLKSSAPKMGVTSSISGRFGYHLRSAYAASKFALHGFFESLRLEHRSDNLSVTMICPGRINTQISLSALTAEGKQHGEMDPGQADGMSAEKCAAKMRKAIEKRRKDVLIGKKEILMVYFRKYVPFLFYYLANKVNPK
jgi:dehydrogenase/reductase SDR family member 7B